ncbi:MAG: DNA polymerase III subunit delta [Clostridia bacterium]|nr:DNA polymerase III subunit delta [Clostridia bacterium]
MAIQTEESVKQDLKNKRFAPCYLLFGDDPFLKKSYADRLERAAVEGDPFFNLQRFSGNIDLQEVYDAVTQYPLMADRKCVQVIDCDFEHLGKNDFDRLCLLVGEGGDTCVLILRFDGVNFDEKKSSKAKALIAAAEKVGGKAVRLNHKTPAELVRVLTEGAKKRGCSMDAATARFMIETVGTDTGILANELEKLCHFAPGEPLTKKTVREVCIASVEASVYNLTKEIFNRRLSAALSLLDDLFFMRLEPMIILHTVASSYVDLYRVSAAKKNGLSLSSVATDFGYKGREFVLQRAAENLRNIEEKSLRLSFETLLRADQSLKSTGADARTVLEELVVRLIYILTKGEPIDPCS